MHASPCPTSPGQRVQSSSLPSTTATTSRSSTTAGDSSPIFTRIATSSSLSTDSSPVHVKSCKPRPTSARSSVYSRIRVSNPGIWRWILVIIMLALSLELFLHLGNRSSLPYLPSSWPNDPALKAVLHPMGKKRPDPIRWLKQHSSPNRDSKPSHPRSRAALISLVRNEELEGILQSMRHLEFHWNRRYNYPWIFFSEVEFSEEFKAATSNATSARTHYALVPRSHWSTPDWIDRNKYMDSLDYLGTIGVGKASFLSYRNMCRWNSGFFYLHPILASYQYYWRVEPDVHFFCDLHYDPFAFMAANELVYGFNMAILDDGRSFASLWRTTRDFITKHPHLIHPDADVGWLLDPNTGGDYNNCQFFSNFEIGSLDFFRGEANRRYFEHLDRSGGFYYERYGDAPVHTLSASLFAPKSAVWFFRDIGYQHDIARHCPPPDVDVGMGSSGGGGVGGAGAGDKGGHSAGASAARERHDHDHGHSAGTGYDASASRSGRCTCAPTRLDENFYKLVPMESPQEKPADTCIRLWLGGRWLEKKEGWSRDAERVLGGDGYGGYVLEG